MPILNQIHRLFKRGILPIKKLAELNNAYYEDVTDGSVYLNWLKSSKSSKDCQITQNYSFIINTDGIQVAEKSKISIWPVYLAINEIPIGTRYFLNNIIIAGNFNYYLVTSSYSFCYSLF